MTPTADVPAAVPVTAPVTEDLVAALERVGVVDVDDSPLARALYSADASLYRVVPRVVVRPRHRDEVLAALEVARATGVPLTMRGAGTSIAGNAVGPGIVVDTSRHLDRILSVDPEAATARVEPGVVQAALQRAAAPHGLRFGPDPSTHTRCTIGGMIGNNACGARALAYGRTVDNVDGLTVAFGTGEVGAYDASSTLDGPGRRLADVVTPYADHVADRFGRFDRQGSGYALEHLLPGRTRIDRFLVGSEGTLGVVLDATVRLVRDEARSTVVLGYADMAAAGDAVPALLASGARVLACEGLGRSLVDLVLAQGRPVPELPRGEGWLIVEVAEGSRVPALDEVARRSLPAPEAAALWRIREDGAGLAGLGSAGRPAYSGWEDAAVPPDRLGEWLRTFDSLLDEHGLHGVPYGHFGDGCVHVRIDFPFQRAGEDAPRVFRDFLLAAAVAVTGLGGSISGEHGDGRVRSELLPLMFDATSMGLFGALKAAVDPEGVLNPGVLVDPAPVDADLRPARPRVALPTLTDGAHRCTGVGKCLVRPAAGVMCPSYAATRDERDSTRGRARVLQEALDRDGVLDGLEDAAVGEALDLCLACKGCARDCPTGVDMATYKAEVLDRVWRGRRRPRSHYTLGRLPALLRLPGAGPLGSALGLAPVAAVAKRVAGVDPRRSLPVPARRSWRGRGRSRPATGDGPGSVDVWLWADTFTDRFAPRIGAAAVQVLAAAGLRAAVLPADACCGLTWISTGQLDHARSLLRRAVERLVPYVDSGVPVVGLEPSCLATLRSDLGHLLPDSAPAARVAGGVRTLAELLTSLDGPARWLPDLEGVEVVAQPHCHHASILGWEADEALLRRAGARVTRVGGCCGLAGNFGMERGHHDVSVAVAETQLLPAVREAGPEAVVLADGLSCRHQLADLADVRSLHLAELLAAQLPSVGEAVGPALRRR